MKRTVSHSPICAWLGKLRQGRVRTVPGRRGRELREATTSPDGAWVLPRSLAEVSGGLWVQPRPLGGCSLPCCAALSRRLCGWVLLRLLSRLFLSVQLHRGQLEMVLRAATTVRSAVARSRHAAAAHLPLGTQSSSPPPSPQPDVPLVFLSTHKSQLDGLLLSFLFFSNGLGVPRVTVDSLNCSPCLR